VLLAVPVLGVEPSPLDVKATDAAGNAEQTPASPSWEVRAS